jgi:hypothetical protein
VIDARYFIDVMLSNLGDVMRARVARLPPFDRVLDDCPPGGRGPCRKCYHAGTVMVPHAECSDVWQFVRCDRCDGTGWGDPYPPENS